MKLIVLFFLFLFFNNTNAQNSLKNDIGLKYNYIFFEGLKHKSLYNYDKALVRSLETATLFLVEGQGDVWKMYEAGVTNCVGLFGKDISNKQKELLLLCILDRDTLYFKSKV